MLILLEKGWCHLRMFSYRNRTIVELFFLALYSLEQAFLILLTSFYPDQINLLVSLFAVAVLATFGLHKYTMESRIRILENEVSMLNLSYQEALTEVYVLRKKYKKITRMFAKTEDLNN